eukprot:TRINITY_DN9024_c0_g1_i1.p1 TRINITY_DN9024_c0_g1~~TRINITY_DN9024_c0_g1_i1.p1  ORF type:complete len:389 (-),score=165.95 TRINITY_DN9024_c0_g1_i1:51-1082(-)
MRMFDRDVKRAQQARAALAEGGEASREVEYLRDETARRLVERLGVVQRKFPVVVDLGAHAGNVRKALAEAWPRGEMDDNEMGMRRLVQLDHCPEMLTRDVGAFDTCGEGGQAAAGLESVEYVVADEEFLPFEPQSVDLVVSNLSMHWVNDLPAMLRQVREMLRPDGLFIASMIGGHTLQELRSAITVAEMERTDGVGPHVSPFTTMQDMGDLLTNAGFALPTVDRDVIETRYPDMFTLIEHLQLMGESNAALAALQRSHPTDAEQPKSHTFVSRDVFVAANAAYQALYADENGLLRTTFEIINLVAWAPSDDQSKPLPRGSAEARFKDIDAMIDEYKDEKSKK